MIAEYLKNSPTAWHGVKELATFFDNAGFTQLKEEDRWQLEPGKGYYLTRSGRSLAAFRVGTAPLPAYRIVAAHTDSPHLRLKKESLKRDGALITGRTSVYGGPILNTWLDRPLALAGSVVIKGKEGIEEKLFDSEEPVGLIPNAAIHLNREVNKGYEILPAKHLQATLNIPGELDEYIAKKLKIEASDILSTQLEFYLPGEPVFLGKGDAALLSSPRIDNLIHCILGARALVDGKDTALTPLCFFFDSEETGSRTPAGAHSDFAGTVMDRIALSLGRDREDQLRSRALSLIISADVAHAWNPNFPEKYDDAYLCKINEGPAVKIDVNNRYATTAATDGMLRIMAEKAGIPLQTFIIHSDLPCGSTVGPMLSADSAIPCADMGIPIWAMHSSCETAGMKDIEDTEKLFKVFFTG